MYEHKGNARNISKIGDTQRNLQNRRQTILSNVTDISNIYEHKQIQATQIAQNQYNQQNQRTIAKSKHINNIDGILQIQSESAKSTNICKMYKHEQNRQTTIYFTHNNQHTQQPAKSGTNIQTQGKQTNSTNIDNINEIKENEQTLTTHDHQQHLRISPKSTNINNNYQNKQH